MYGIIGRSLKHSFSPRYFNALFKKLQIHEEYFAFPLNKVDEFPELLFTHPSLHGLNVTAPFKESIIPFLTELDTDAKAIGAVNCIKIKEGKLKGYNTDFIGFTNSLMPLLKAASHQSALILGTGGASKAISYALKSLDINFQYVSRTKRNHFICYDDLTEDVISKNTLIINTTPLGTDPEIDHCPDIPYNYLTKNHLLYDLIYNPEETLFLKKGAEQGATIKNGYEMLIAQAEASWGIWNNEEQISKSFS